MKTSLPLPDFVFQVNDRIDAIRLLEYINFSAESIQPSGTSVKAFCPIHQDRKFRSLLIDTERHTFKCTLKTCVGFAGGTLVDLLGLVKEKDSISAAIEMAESVDLDLDPDWRSHLVDSLVELAWENITSGDLEISQKLLEPALAVLPDSATARLALADLLLRRDKKVEAREQFVAAAELLLEKGDFAKADEVLNSALEIFQDNEDLLFLQVRSAELQHNTDTAYQRLNHIVQLRETANRNNDNFGILQKLVEMKPDDMDARFKLATLHEERRDLRNAGREFEKVARLRIAAGEIQTGIELLEKVVRFEPEMLRVRLDLAALLIQEGNTDKARTQTFECINYLIDQQDYVASAKTVISWLETEPESLEARELLARIYQDQERLDEAAEQLKLAARLSEKQGNPQRAAEMLQRTKFLIPTDIDVREQLVSLLRAMQQPQRAGFEVVDLAELLFNMGQITNAVTLLQTAAQTDVPVAMKCQFAESLMSHGASDHANEILNAAKAGIDPETNPTDAVLVYDTLSKLRPDDNSINIELVRILWETDPRRAAEVTASTVEKLLTNQADTDAGKLLILASEKVQCYVDPMPRLIDQSIRLGLHNEAGKLYTAGIQTFADVSPARVLDTAILIANSLPNHPTAESDCGYLLVSLERPHEASTAFANVALRLLKNDDLEAAAQYASEAIASDPNNVQAILARCSVIVAVEGPAAAEETLRQLFTALATVTDAQTMAAGYQYYFQHAPALPASLRPAAENLQEIGAAAASAAYFHSLSKQLTAQGENQSALESAEQAFNLAPDESAYQFTLASLLEISNDSERAAEIYMISAASKAEAKDIAGAIDLAQKAIGLNPKDVSAWELLASQFETSGKSIEAADAWLHVAQLHDESGHAQDALRWAQHASEIDASSAEAKFELGRLYEQMNQTEDAAAGYSEAARISEKAKNWNKSLEAYKGIVRIGRADAAMLTRIGKVAGSADETSAAGMHELLATGWADLKEFKKAEAAVGKLEATAGPSLQTALARKAMAQAAENDLLAAHLWAAASHAYEEINDLVEAIKCLLKVLDISNDNLDAHKRLASLFEKIGQPERSFPHRLRLVQAKVASGEKAVSELQDIRNHAGESADRHLLIAEALVSEGKSNLAMEDLERAATLANEAGNVPLLMRICEVDDATTRASLLLSQAKADALMSLEQASDAADWLKQNCTTLLESGRGEEAAQLAKRLIHMKPDNVDAHRLLVQTYASLDNKPAALDAGLKLAALLEKNGDSTSAVEEVERILKLDQEHIPALAMHVSLKQQQDPESAAPSMRRLADVYEKKKMQAEHLELREKIATLSSVQTDDLLKLANLLYTAKNPHLAISRYQEWIDSRRQTDDPAKIADDYDSIVSRFKDNTTLVGAAADFMLMNGFTERGRTLLFQLAKLEKKHNHYEKAARAMDRALHSPGYSPTGAELLDLAQYHIKGNQPDKAATALRSAANTFFNAGNSKEAAKASARLMTVAPPDSLTHEDYLLHARILAASPQSDTALEAYGKALDALPIDSETQGKRIDTLKEILELAPNNADYSIQYLGMLSADTAIEQAIAISRRMRQAESFEESARVLDYAGSLAPWNLNLRKEALEGIRALADNDRLRSELMSLASDAISMQDQDLADSLLRELSEMATTGTHHKIVAELYEKNGQMPKAAEEFSLAAENYCAEKQEFRSLACLHKGLAAGSDAVPAQTIALMVRSIGEPVHDVAREQLRTALTARNQRRSQTIAMAILETMEPARFPDILKTVNSLGGSNFAVTVAHGFVEQLLNQEAFATAKQVVDALTDIISDSPDAWYLAGRVCRRAKAPKDGRFALTRAAALYHEGGAVSEEEICLLEVLEFNSDDIEIQQMLADYYVRENRQEEAIGFLTSVADQAEAAGTDLLFSQSLEKAIAIAPANVDLQERLASHLESSGNSSAIPRWLSAAQLHDEEGRRDKASLIFERVLKLDPLNVPALSELLRYALESADKKRATNLRIQLADAKVVSGSLREACTLLQQVLETNPEDLAALEKLSELAKTTGDSETADAASRALAQKLHKKGDYQAAIRHYDALLQKLPENIAILQALMDCCAATGDTKSGAHYAYQLLETARRAEDSESARRAATAILLYDESRADARRDLAEALLCLNHVPEAVAEWSRAAEQFEVNNQTQEAVDCYRCISQVAPGNTQAWKKLADLSAENGDLDTARIAYEYLVDKYGESNDFTKIDGVLTRLLALDPDDPVPHSMALHLFKKAGRLEQTIEQVQWLAEHSMRHDQHMEAETIIQEGLKLAPDNLALQRLRFQAIRLLGRTDELQVRLRETADALLARNEIPQAIAALEQIREIAPARLDIRRELCTLYMQIADSSSAIEEVAAMVRLLLERNEFEEAREAADAAIEDYANSVELRARVAEVFSEYGMSDLAARHYAACAREMASKNNGPAEVVFLERATNARPTWEEGLRLLADACIRQNDNDGKFAAFERLAAILVENNDFAEAERVLGELIKQRPDSTLIRTQMAGVYERIGNKANQAAQLRELAERYISSGRTEQALETYRKLEALNPDDAGIQGRFIELLSQSDAAPNELARQYFKLAQALSNRGEIVPAMQAYEQSLAMDRTNTQTQEQFAAFLLTHGEKGRALMEMRKLANTYSDNNDRDAAVEILNAALAITPRDADLCLALAAAQDAAGQKDAARVSYARASAILANTAAVKGISTYRRILAQDENNTPVRQRLIEVLLSTGDHIEAAREARKLAEIYVSLGQFSDAENAYRMVNECEPETLEDIETAIQRDSYDPNLQYVHYVRYGDRLFAEGNVDRALDTYRVARSLHDDRTELIQKCIECVSLIAPEAEAIPDYLVLGEKYLVNHDLMNARHAYDQVRMIDPFNHDARQGLESITAVERQSAVVSQPESASLATGIRPKSRRVGLNDLLIACQDAATAADETGDKKLYDSKKLEKLK